MASISETELQRRLRSLEKKNPSGGTSYVGESAPTGTNYENGDTHYDSVLNNLWLFNDGTWNLTSKQLHIYYADNVANVNSDGTVNAQNDVTGFSQTPFDSSGTQKAWRGLWWGPTDVASTDPTDYEWTLTSGEAGDAPSYTRYYTTYPGLLSELGDPDNTVTGVTWTALTGTAPSTAYWVAEKFTVGTDVSPWAIYPVQAKEGGIPFVRATKAGYNKPTLGDATWITDAVAAVSSFTGRSYSNQKEFGYGTVVVIEYDNGKLFGKYTRSGNSDTWVDPAEFIDGDLVVDGTIAAEKIQATSIDATKLVITGTNAITHTTVGADPAGAAATAESNATSDAAADASSKVAVVTNNIYTTNTTTIDGGAITAGSIRAENIAAGTITATELASDSVTANAIDIDGSISFSDNSSGIKFGKSSLADGTAGAFYGRGVVNGSNVAGFAISSSSSSFSIDSSGTFRMVNAKIYVGQPNVPTFYENPSLNGTSSYTISVVPGTTDLDIVVVGAGGGGQSNAAGDQDSSYQNSGSDGGFSRVRCFDSNGSVVKTIYAAGGAGATYSVQSNLNSGDGPAGEDSTHGTGGAGGVQPANSGTASTPSSGTRGSGGGSGGALGFNGSPDAIANNSGEAGETEESSTIPSTTTSLVIEVGTGGAGGAGGAGVIAAGGNGGAGVVIITHPTAGGDEIDLEEMRDNISDLMSGSPTWNSDAGSTSSSNTQITQTFGSGAGWYDIKVDGGLFLANSGAYSLTGLIANDSSGGTKQYGGISRYYFSSTPSVSGLSQPTNNSFRYIIKPFKWYKVM